MQKSVSKPVVVAASVAIPGSVAVEPSEFEPVKVVTPSAEAESLTVLSRVSVTPSPLHETVKATASMAARATKAFAIRTRCLINVGKASARIRICSRCFTPMFDTMCSLRIHPEALHISSIRHS